MAFRGMKLKTLANRVESPRYHTGYSRWKRIGIYINFTLATAVVAGIIGYTSCANNVNVEQPKAENVQHYEMIQNGFEGGE